MKDISHVLKKQAQLIEIELFNQKSSIYITNKLKMVLKMVNGAAKILDALEKGKAVWVTKKKKTQ